MTKGTGSQGKSTQLLSLRSMMTNTGSSKAETCPGTDVNTAHTHKQFVQSIRGHQKSFQGHAAGNSTQLNSTKHMQKYDSPDF